MVWSILVADDSAVARQHLRVAFEAKGARVIEAANGQEGLWRARAETVDLVFTDVHMPVLDGLRMVQELRATPEHASTPIFVLTSDASTTRQAEGKNAGANAWLIKPINPDALWKVVQKALSGRRPNSSATLASASAQSARDVNK